MALRRQSQSPTANLLRNSRLFSLPNPLPRPNVGATYGAGITRASDTATLPYPTHQAIATTKSSLARGDWGLKRPLPARSRLLQTSDPVLRITQLDTIEHITDFDSAADHVRTRQKFEELATPMMQGMSQMRDYDLSVPPRGAFEERDDTTSYDTDLGLDEAGMFLQTIRESSKENNNSKRYTPFKKPPVDKAAHNSKRWKHDGPWIPGMNADDFLEYVTKQITYRREEFNTYLTEYVKNEIYTTRQLAASKDGETVPLDTAEAEKWQAKKSRKWSKISPADIEAGIKALRKETAIDPLRSRLMTHLIVPFLRLPAIKLKNTQYAESATSRDVDQYQFDQETAPLSTHPSAGLGYLRNKSYITNHPILGPQSKPGPVPARVIQPRTTARSREAYAKLGVAGFVANDEFRSNNMGTNNNRNRTNTRDVETIDIDTPGGTKVMVQPVFGSVDNSGRIHLKLLRSFGAEVAVARGELDDRPPVREGYQSDPLADLGKRNSGIAELNALGRAGRDGGGSAASGGMGRMRSEEGAHSARARQLEGFLEGMRPEADGKGTPGRGFPGIGDALR